MAKMKIIPQPPIDRDTRHGEHRSPVWAVLCVLLGLVMLAVGLWVPVSPRVKYTKYEEPVASSESPKTAKAPEAAVSASDASAKEECDVSDLVKTPGESDDSSLGNLSLDPPKSLKSAPVADLKPAPASKTPSPAKADTPPTVSGKLASASPVIRYERLKKSISEFEFYYKASHHDELLFPPKKTPLAKSSAKSTTKDTGKSGSGSPSKPEPKKAAPACPT